VTGTPAGPIVDGLQITFESIESDHLVADAVVIAKVIEADGSVRLACSWSDSLSWVERLGMLRAAERMSLPDSSQWEDG